MLQKYSTSLSVFFFLFYSSIAQESNLITNIENRQIYSLNGQWEILIDPYENGFYNYRYQEHENGFFKNEKPKTKQDLIEYDFNSSDYLNVPGDWNSQREKLELYEGTIWHKKSFQFSSTQNKRRFLYISAANYSAHVYINGKKIGVHEGGFTPFNFEVTNFLTNGENFVVIKVDNKRKADGIPTLNTDWWNYGGLTRDVYLVETNTSFIRDYTVQLKKGSKNTLSISFSIDNPNSSSSLTLIIPELKIKKNISLANTKSNEIEITGKLQLWSPSKPKLYTTYIVLDKDTLIDQIGFRTIETRGEDILLNGEPIFLKGICIHEEIPQRVSRANGYDDAKLLLNWAKELGCNYVRLAHYPHNEAMVD